MKIHTYDFVDGARKAQGSVVIIDVFRAFSTACYAFANGASSVIAVGEIEKARQLKLKISGGILIGERGGQKIEGFDYGNSPTEIESVDFTGKTLILTTHAGTQGLVNATSSGELFTGSFVNARATAQWILAAAPSEVSLVRMGLAATQSSDEDDLCSDYLKSLCLDLPFDSSRVKSILKASPCSTRFFDKNKPWSPERDFDLCLDVDKFDFALQAQVNEEGLVYLKPVSS